ncbi:MAG: ABC transporter permease [Nitrososphaerales archaeon]
MRRLNQNLLKYLSITEVNRFLLLIFLSIFIFALNPFFLSEANLGLVLVWGSIYAIMVMGATLYLLVGALDLSFGGVITLSNVLAAILMLWYGFPVWLAVLIVLILGFTTGLATCYFGLTFSPPFRFILPTFIFTLMLSFVYIGAMRIVTRAFPVYGLPESYSLISRSTIGPIPIVTIYMIVILAILGFFIYYRPIGKHIYATGLNDDVARRVGVNVKKVRLIALSVGSLIQAFAGVLLGSQLAQGSVLIGPTYLLPILAGAFIGGVSLAGGEGSLFGAILGGFTIYLIENIIVTLAVEAFWKEVVVGLFLLLFVLLDFIQKRRTMRR